MFLHLTLLVLYVHLQSRVVTALLRGVVLIQGLPGQRHKRLYYGVVVGDINIQHTKVCTEA